MAVGIPEGYGSRDQIQNDLKLLREWHPMTWTLSLAQQHPRCTAVGIPEVYGSRGHTRLKDEVASRMASPGPQTWTLPSAQQHLRCMAVEIPEVYGTRGKS